MVKNGRPSVVFTNVLSSSFEHAFLLKSIHIDHVKRTCVNASQVIVGMDVHFENMPEVRVPDPNPDMYNPYEDDARFEDPGLPLKRAEWAAGRKLESQLREFPADFPGPKPHEIMGCPARTRSEANRMFIAWMYRKFTRRAVHGVFRAMVDSYRIDNQTATEILRYLLPQDERTEPRWVNWCDLEVRADLNVFGGYRQFYITAVDLRGQYVANLNTLCRYGGVSQLAVVANCGDEFAVVEVHTMYSHAY